MISFFSKIGFKVAVVIISTISSISVFANEIRCSKFAETKIEKRIAKNLNVLTYLKESTSKEYSKDRSLNEGIEFATKMQEMSEEQIRNVEFPYYRNLLKRHLPSLKEALRQNLDSPFIYKIYEAFDLKGDRIDINMNLREYTEYVIQMAEARLAKGVIDIYWFSDFVFESVNLQKILQARKISEGLKEMGINSDPSLQSVSSPRNEKIMLYKILESKQLPLFSYELGNSFRDFFVAPNSNVQIMGLAKDLVVSFDGAYGSLYSFARHDVLHTVDMVGETKSSLVHEFKPLPWTKEMRLFQSELIKEAFKLDPVKQKEFFIMWFAFFHEAGYRDFSQAVIYNNLMKKDDPASQILVNPEVFDLRDTTFSTPVYKMLMSSYVEGKGFYGSFVFDSKDLSVVQIQKGLENKLEESFKDLFIPVIEKARKNAKNFIEENALTN